MLPYEIICQWLDQHNSGVCKLWRQMWYNKPISIKFKNCAYDVSRSNDCLSKFQHLAALRLGKGTVVDWSSESLTKLKTLIVDANNFVSNNKIRHLTNLTTLSLNNNKKITSINQFANIVELSLYNNKIIRN